MPIRRAAIALLLVAAPLTGCRRPAPSASPPTAASTRDREWVAPTNDPLPEVTRFTPDLSKPAPRSVTPAPAPIVVDSTLRIPLRNGDTLSLLSIVHSEERSRRYTYQGHVAGAPFHVVRVQYYEGGGYFLVHDSTGKQVGVDAPPLASPSRRELLVASWAADDYGTPKTLTIYAISGDSLIREYRTEPSSWGPKSATWVGNDTISVVKGVWTGPSGAHQEVPAYLARDAGEWALHGGRVAQ